MKTVILLPLEEYAINKINELKEQIKKENVNITNSLK
mgnify:CR=1 FL=1